MDGIYKMEISGHLSLSVSLLRVIKGVFNLV